MKDKIYTIPVNEAFDESSECPLCSLKKRLEDEAVEYALGAAMMEPDYRVMSNEKGYCNKHFGMLFKKPNKLSLALTMDTHMQELQKKIDALTNAALEDKEKKSSFFKKEKDSHLNEALRPFKESVQSCLICEKLDYTMERYVRVFFQMYKEDREFREKTEKSKGFCLVHFTYLLEEGKKHLSQNDFKNFSLWLCEKEKAELERVHRDVHNFTLKFDYRNHATAWGSEKDGPERGVQKISGYITD